MFHDLKPWQEIYKVIVKNISVNLNPLYQSSSLSIGKSIANLNRTCFSVENFMDGYNCFLSSFNSTMHFATQCASIPLSAIKTTSDVLTIGNPLMRSAADSSIKRATDSIDYLIEITKEYKEPILDVKYTTLWENELVKLNIVKSDSDNRGTGNTSTNFLLYLPIMRGPYLAFYTENAETIKSVGKALLRAKAGNILFTDWKNPSEKTLHSSVEDYIQTYHELNQVVKEVLGEVPVNVDLCQPGYFDMIRLSRYPDDCLAAILVASPHKTMDEESVVYDNLINYNRKDLAKIIEQCGGKFPGKLLAESWGLANLMQIADRVYNEPFEIMIGIQDGTYNPTRRDRFNEWMYHDVRDVAGPTILEIRDIFQNESMINEPIASAQKNYKRPIIVVTGDSDDIVTAPMALSVLDYVGTPDKYKCHFNVQGGHAGVFNGSAAFNKKSAGFDDWMHDIIPKTQQFVSEIKKIIVN